MACRPGAIFVSDNSNRSLLAWGRRIFLDPTEASWIVRKEKIGKTLSIFSWGDDSCSMMLDEYDTEYAMYVIPPFVAQH